MFKREYIVQLVVESTHEYSISATSEEEAVGQAELEYERGNVGSLMGFDVQMADGFLADGDPEEGDDEEEFD